MKYHIILFCLLYIASVGLSYDSLGSDDKNLRSQLSRKTTQITLIKKTYYLDSKLNIPAGKQVNANGAVFVFNNVMPNEWMLTLNSGCKLSNLEILGAGETAEFNFVINGAEVYRKFNFNYTPSFNAIWLMGKQISLDNIKINGCQKGIGGNVTQVTMNRLNVKGSYASIEMYISKNIKVTNSTFYGGSFGCITFPSCNDITVEHCTLYNPKSTGVNPGGAALENLTPKNIVVRHNNIIAGDCINLENGAADVQITDNVIQCAPIVNNQINNSAIAVQVHDPKANSFIRNITIKNNNISAFENIIYGIGINVGNILGNTINKVSIFNNTIAGGNEGIRVENKKNFYANSILIQNNTIDCYAFGIRLFQVTHGEILSNKVKAYKSTWNDNLWGIQMHKCSNLTLTQNTTKGFLKHYYETEQSYNIEIRKPNAIKGEESKPFSVLYSEPSLPQTKDRIKLRND